MYHCHQSSIHFACDSSTIHVRIKFNIMGWIRLHITCKCFCSLHWHFINSSILSSTLSSVASPCTKQLEVSFLSFPKFEIIWLAIVSKCESTLLAILSKFKSKLLANLSIASFQYGFDQIGYIRISNHKHMENHYKRIVYSNHDHENPSN